MSERCSYIHAKHALIHGGTLILEIAFDRYEALNDAASFIETNELFPSRTKETWCAGVLHVLCFIGESLPYCILEIFFIRSGFWLL